MNYFIFFFLILCQFTCKCYLNKNNNHWFMTIGAILVTQNPVANPTPFLVSPKIFSYRAISSLTSSPAAALLSWRRTSSGGLRPWCWFWRYCSPFWWSHGSAGWTAWPLKRYAARSSPSRRPPRLRTKIRSTRTRSTRTRSTRTSSSRTMLWWKLWHHHSDGQQQAVLIVQSPRATT